MLQRNPGPYIIDIPTLQPPVRLNPGDTVEHDEPLAGLVEVTDDKEKSDKPNRVVGRSKPAEGETVQ